jgi:ABC-type nitrate/sulfonate/bicarbonate transport system substrate-binding protein
MPIHRIGRRTFITRSGALLGLAALPQLLAACGDDDDDDTTSGSGGGSGTTTSLAVQLNWIKNVEFAGFWLADAQGFYAEEGLDVDLIGGGPNAPEPVQTVAGDGAQIGISSDLLTIFDAIAQGTDLVIFGAKLQSSPLGLLSLPDNPVNTAADIVGKRVGGPEGDDLFIDAVLAANGLPNDYTFVPTGYDPDPLVQGDCDVLSVYVTNQPITLQLVHGITGVAVTLSDMGLPSYADLLFAKRDWLAANTDTAVGFLRATIKGWELNAQDPAAAAQLTIDEYGQDLDLELEQQTLENEAQVQLVQSPLTAEKGIFYVSVDELGGPMYTALEATGRTDLPDAASVVDLSILEAAYDGATTLLS